MSRNAPADVHSDDDLLVDVGHFVQATRDSGYRSAAYALFELVDNAIEAGARTVAVVVSGDIDGGPIVEVADDGCGMSPDELRNALRFGGSSRFDQRDGLGRFGMGLPNSSLSHARRVDVRTWRRQGVEWQASLDLDEVVDGRRTRLLPPTRVKGWTNPLTGPSGTVVTWSKCDRLHGQQPKALARHLADESGRVYRRFLADGTVLTVNGRPVLVRDPLLLGLGGTDVLADPYGPELEYELDPGRLNLRGPSKVRVRFSELRIGRLAHLPNPDKRRLGIVRGAGVSIMRAGRELDYGWHFLGDKRRENYDDWWRCEVSFAPEADEVFGLTHAKQAIRPSRALTEILAPDMEAVARTLNDRVRRTFEALKRADLARMSESMASAVDKRLPPLREGVGKPDLIRFLRQHSPEVRPTLDDDGSGLRYRVRVTQLPHTMLFDFIVEKGVLLLLLNERHPLVRDVYLPLTQDSTGGLGARQALELLLLALARAEARVDVAGAAYRAEWSDTLATFLSDAG